MLNECLPLLTDFLLILSEATVAEIVSNEEFAEVLGVRDTLRPVVFVAQVILNDLSLLTVTF